MITTRSVFRNSVWFRANAVCAQLLMTGNMLFEIIDPFLMWKQIYTSVRSSVSGEGNGDSIELARFVVRTFRLHDEEVQRLHAPFMAFGILDLIDVSPTSFSRIFPS